VNGSLSLSRVIGDRCLRPYVISDPDVISIPLKPQEDDFIVLATDGLWDVMTSMDVVAYIHALLDNQHDYDFDFFSNNHNIEHTNNKSEEQQQDRHDIITSMIVEEALRRGSSDNITVLIVWLGEETNDRQRHEKKKQQITDINSNNTSLMMNEDMPFP
jgi:serine/threonine protein phosphatase PrpC